jgi:hypothetical protein
MRMSDTRGLGAVAGMVLASLGGGCLDSLGHEEDVIEHRANEGMLQIEDDRIEDKHPIYDAQRTVTESFGPNPYNTCAITMNKSAAVTKLDIVPFEAAETALDKRLFHGRGEALGIIAGIGGDAIPSMEVVNGALKPFNDGLYAAVELEAEASKRALFSALAARLTTLAAAAGSTARPAFDDAAVLVGAAQILAGDTPTIDTSLQSRAQARAGAFQSDAALARPIGFYTWTPALGRVFTRDRFLQNRDDGESYGAFAAIAFALGQDAALLADYQHVAGIYAGLTNPFTSYTIDALIPYVTSQAALANPAAIESAFLTATTPRKACGYVPVAFLPASRSKETDYFDEQFCFGVPDGTNPPRCWRPRRRRSMNCCRRMRWRACSTSWRSRCTHMRAIWNLNRPPPCGTRFKPSKSATSAWRRVPHAADADYPGKINACNSRCSCASSPRLSSTRRRRCAALSRSMCWQVTPTWPASTRATTPCMRMRTRTRTPSATRTSN